LPAPCGDRDCRQSGSRPNVQARFFWFVLEWYASLRCMKLRLPTEKTKKIYKKIMSPFKSNGFGFM
jgi:hypothetical protein